MSKHTKQWLEQQALWQDKEVTALVTVTLFIEIGRAHV